MDNLTRTLIHTMARRTRTVLTPEHLRVLEFAHEWYTLKGVGPLFRNIARFTGTDKARLEAIFPNGLESVYAWVGIPVQSVRSGCKPYASVDVRDRREVYLDYNATTPVRPEVANLLVDYFRGPLTGGNPSSSSRLGKLAWEAVNQARSRVAATLSTSPENIVFTSGGSEAINMAIQGVAMQFMERKGHIITTKVEHHAVSHTIEHLTSMFGFESTFLDVDSAGRVSAEDVRRAIRPDTILVSVIFANNEIGTINPIAEIGAVCRQAGVFFMTDAVQAYGKVPIDPAAMGISLMSMSGHKIYGPKGVGALYIDDQMMLTPLIHGGGQEFGLRSGTENVPGIMAFGLAAELMHQEMAAESARIAGLRDDFLNRLAAIEPGYVLNGAREGRLRNNLNIGLPGVDSGSLLLSLNRIGVYVSSGSACSAGSAEASHVLRAIGADIAGYGNIRVSFGRETTVTDLDYLFRYLPGILASLRKDA